MPQLVTFTSVGLGSLIVGGAASVAGSGNPSQPYNNLQNAIQTGNTLGGYPVTSSSIQAQGFTPES